MYINLIEYSPSLFTFLMADQREYRFTEEPIARKLRIKVFKIEIKEFKIIEATH